MKTPQAIGRAFCLGCVAWLGMAGAVPLRATDLFINEIYFDPPSSGDATQEYVELRGTPGMSLDNHYLIFLENEDNELQRGNPGQVEFVFDLNGRQIGSNGFLTLRQKGSPYTSIAAGSTDLVNAGSGASWGKGPETNTIGVSSIDGIIENSGFTAMLIQQGTGPAPTLGMLLDGLIDNDGAMIDEVDPTPHDGLDYPTGQPGWSILDSIGLFSEFGEAPLGRLYAQINFGPEKIGEPAFEGGPIFEKANIESGAQYVGLGFEIEYLGRLGNSTGTSEKDWVLANLTNNPLSGFVSAAQGFHQAGSDPHGFPRPNSDDGSAEAESNQYIPYGTNLNATIGSANYPLNQTRAPWDYNQNGIVDAADMTVWRDTLGTPDLTAGTNPLAANADRDGSVDVTDYLAWSYHFGDAMSPLPAPAAAVPEPASWGILLLTAGCGWHAVRRGSPRTRAGRRPTAALGAVLIALATFSHLSAAPLLTVSDGGTNGDGNRLWNIEVSPDPSRFTATSQGLGGSLAAEVGLTTSGASIVHVVINSQDWPYTNPGNNPFTQQISTGAWQTGNDLFLAFGSNIFTSAQPRTLATLVTLGSGATTLSWGGHSLLANTPFAYTGSRLAQGGQNFDNLFGTLSLGSLIGDLNQDGAVDAADAAIMFGNWGNGGEGDLSADGIVDAADAGILFGNWTGDAAISLPEPAAGVIVLGGLAMASIGRRSRR